MKKIIFLLAIAASAIISCNSESGGYTSTDQPAPSTNETQPKVDSTVVIPPVQN